MKDWLERLLLTAFLFISFSFGVYISNHYYQPQIDGLTKQLDRTQYQLKRAKKQNVEQTKKIAELTRNGG